MELKVRKSTQGQLFGVAYLWEDSNYNLTAVGIHNMKGCTLVGLIRNYKCESLFYFSQVIYWCKNLMRKICCTPDWMQRATYTWIEGGHVGNSVPLDWLIQNLYIPWKLPIESKRSNCQFGLRSLSLVILCYGETRVQTSQRKMQLRYNKLYSSPNHYLLLFGGRLGNAFCLTQIAVICYYVVCVCVYLCGVPFCI